MLAHSPRIVTDGLILAVDAANTKSYAGTGTATKDLTSNAADGVLSANATFSSAQGGIFQLDSTSNLTHLGSNLNTVVGSDPFTFSLTMRLKEYPPSGTPNRHGILQKGSYNPSFGLNLFYAGASDGVFTNARFYFGLRNLTGTAGVTPGYGIFDRLSTMFLDLNQWYKVDFTHSFAGTTHTLKLYVNGVLDSTHQSSNSLFPINITNTSILGINAQILGGNFIGGNIDVASYSVYLKELTLSEVQQNYNATRGRFGI